MWPQKTSESAARLCGIVLTQGRAFGQFVVHKEQARRAMNLKRDEFERIVGQAVKRDWIRDWSDRIALKAAGIHVAKTILDLPH